MIWTRAQRTVLAVLVLLLAAGLSLRYACNPSHIADPMPASFPAAAQLADRVDPNTADWQTLAAIPGLGPRRAQEILADRDRFLQDHPGQVAYARLEDLDRVKGIGPATLTLLEPYLTFPSSVVRPTTRP